MLSPITKTERQKREASLSFVHSAIGRVRFNWIVLAARMEDDYLPLYEVVDQDKSDPSHKNNTAESGGYERLISDVTSVLPVSKKSINFHGQTLAMYVTRHIQK